MKRILLFALLCLFLLPAVAQQPLSWEQLWQETVDAEDFDEAALEDAYERMAQLAQNPLDINAATREELEQLPFLTATQVMDLVEYRDRYGPVRTVRELKMIPSLDYRELELLPFFLRVADGGDGNGGGGRPENGRGRAGRGSNFWRSLPPPRAAVTLTGRVPFYDRRGDQNGYLGPKYRHSLRLEYNHGQRLRAGLIGAQDAGEPFFAQGNNWGYDHYSYYLEVNRLGCLDRVVVGKYRVSAGMGLVLGSTFTLGKLASMQSLGRQPTTLRPHTSRSQADYFLGAAATVGLLRRRSHGEVPLKLTLFASHRPMDGTLAVDGSVTTLTADGYHRTATEMRRKDNTHLTAFGGRLAYSGGGLRVGLNAVATHLDRRLQPATATLFRRHYAAGTDFFNASIDYGWTTHRLDIGGETAMNGDGAVATVNRLSWQPSSSLALMALWRSYSYRYTGLYAHSFGDNSKAQNERGLFIGTTWRPLPRMTVTAYADYAYFPWARYLVSQPSHAYDMLLQSQYRLSRWHLLARGRARLRQRDNEDKTALTGNNQYQARLAATYNAKTGWSARTQIDGSRAFYLKESLGWMVSEQLSWQKRSWMVAATAAWFHTDDYASRLYQYERLPTHEFYMPAYYGHGIHLALLARKDITGNLTLTARISYTNHFDRTTIGTGLQQIDSSHQTDLDVQLRWRLFQAFH